MKIALDEWLGDMTLRVGDKEELILYLTAPGRIQRHFRYHLYKIPGMETEELPNDAQV